MTNEEYQLLRSDILNWVETRLKPKRFQHTLGVEETAISLARIHGCPVEPASLAALLHDNAKYLSNKTQLAICKQAYPEIELTEEFSAVLHAFAGAAVAHERYPSLTDDIIQAVAYHTTGRPGMNLLEKIIYAADFVEPGREPFPGLALVRERTFKNLDEGVYSILQQTIEYVMMKKKRVHPLTIATIHTFYNV